MQLPDWRLEGTAEAEKVAARLREHGACILEAAADAATIGALRGELAPQFDAIPTDRIRNRTRRIHSRVLAGSPSFGRLVLHPLVRAVCAIILGPNCVKDQLSSVQGIEVWPGAGAQDLHRDDA